MRGAARWAAPRACGAWARMREGRSERARRVWRMREGRGGREREGRGGCARRVAFAGAGAPYACAFRGKNGQAPLRHSALRATKAQVTWEGASI